MRVGRNSLWAISAGIFLIFLFLAFLVGQAVGSLFLPLLFVGLALAILIGSFNTLNSRGASAGIYGFIWCLGLAFCFFFGFWPWILFVVAISLILGALMRPLMAALTGLGLMAIVNSFGDPPPRPYPQQSYQQPDPAQNPYPQQNPYLPQDPYQQGYQQSSPVSESQQEGGKLSYPYPSASYEQPESQYPQQELPPQ